MKRTPRILAILAIALLPLGLMTLQLALASLQLGDGWLSSKLLVRDGVADSQLLLARDGVADSFLTLATAPTMVTGDATGATIIGKTGQATLHGTLSNLNGMPSAIVGFMWGYSSTSMGNATSTTTVNATGDYTITLSGFDPLLDIYYRAIGTTDGVTYGASDNFAVQRAIMAFTGLETVILSTPIILWVALLAGSVLSFYGGIKTEIYNHRLIMIGIGIALLTVAVIIFSLVLDAIQVIRLTL